MPRMNSTTTAETTKMRVTRRLLRNAGLIQKLPVVLAADPDRPAVRDRHVPTVETEPERIEQRVDGGQQQKEDRRGEEEQRDRAARRCGAAPATRDRRLFSRLAAESRPLAVTLFDRHAPVDRVVTPLRQVRSQEAFDRSRQPRDPASVITPQPSTRTLWSDRTSALVVRAADVAVASRRVATRGTPSRAALARSASVQLAATSLSASCGDFCSDIAADSPSAETDEELQPLRQTGRERAADVVRLDDRRPDTVARPGRPARSRRSCAAIPP